MQISRYNPLPRRWQKLVHQRSTAVRVAKNAGWIYANQLLRMVGSLLIGVWVARYLGPEQYGLLNYALALTALIAVVVPLGLSNLVVRNLAIEPENRHNILGTAFFMQLGAAGLAFVLSILIGAWWLNDDTLTRQVILVLSIGTLIKPVAVFDYWFQAQIKSKYSVLASTISLILMMGTRALLVIYAAPLIVFAGMIVVENLINAVSLTYFYRRSGESLRSWRLDLTRVWPLFKEGVPFLLSSIAVLIYMKIDQIMLREMLGNDATGLYSATVRISEIWYFVPAAIVNSIMPVLSKARVEDEQRYYRTLSKLFSIMVVISLSVAIPVTLLATPIMHFFYGPKFASAGPILAVHVWAGLPVAMGLASTPWLINAGLGNIHLQRTMLGAVLNVLLNLWLIPLYQGVGAAIATLAAYCCTTFVWNLFDPRMQRIRVMQWQAFWPPSWLEIHRLYIQIRQKN